MGRENESLNLSTSTKYAKIIAVIVAIITAIYPYVDSFFVNKNKIEAHEKAICQIQIEGTVVEKKLIELEEKMLILQENYKFTKETLTEIKQELKEIKFILRDK